MIGAVLVLLFSRHRQRAPCGDDLGRRLICAACSTQRLGPSQRARSGLRTLRPQKAVNFCQGQSGRHRSFTLGADAFQIWPVRIAGDKSAVIAPGSFTSGQNAPHRQIGDNWVAVRKISNCDPVFLIGRLHHRPGQPGGLGIGC